MEWATPLYSPLLQVVALLKSVLQFDLFFTSLLNHSRHNLAWSWTEMMKKKLSVMPEKTYKSERLTEWYVWHVFTGASQALQHVFATVLLSPQHNFRSHQEHFGGGALHSAACLAGSVRSQVNPRVSRSFPFCCNAHIKDELCQKEKCFLTSFTLP